MSTAPRVSNPEIRGSVQKNRVLAGSEPISGEIMEGATAQRSHQNEGRLAAIGWLSTWKSRRAVDGGNRLRGNK